MIQLKNASLFRGATCLLSETDLQIHDGQKVALIGPNGCGKSSLLSLLRDELHLDEGDCSINPGWRIAHMAQELEQLERPAIEYVLDGDVRLREIQTQLAQAEHAQQHDRIATLHTEMDAADGYTARNRAEQVLSGLGFAEDQFDNPAGTFSGGWRVRLNLARALIQPSDLLLLDEPTNHLDLETCIWLERWLKGYVGTLILISHDRDFINNLADHVVSFEGQKLQVYRGNYDAFEQARAQRLSQQQSAFDKQQVRIAEIEGFVRRFRAKATKARQAQSRLKELERMEKIAPAHIDTPFRFTFREATESSSTLLSLHRTDVGYTEPVLSGLNLELRPGDRIGLLGVNGAGKSTLVKLLAGQLRPLTGLRHEGKHLTVGYFAQHQVESLDSTGTPLSHLLKLAGKATQQECRNFLGGFGFGGEQAESNVGHFSGGEKSRLALALVAWQRPNLLLLDEPTNHLDLEMRHALTVALQAFDGAMVLVSHERHLLRNSVDRFWVVENGKVRVWDDTLDALQQAQRESRGGPASAPAPSVDRKEQKRIDAELRKRLSPIRQQVRHFEMVVEKLDRKLAKIEQQLADTALYEPANNGLLQEVLNERIDQSRQKAVAEQSWFDALEELERAEADLG